MVEPAPLKYMLVKMGKSSTNFGVKIPKDTFETTKQFIMAPYKSPWLLGSGDRKNDPFTVDRDLCGELHWKIRSLANESFPESGNERLQYASGRNILKGQHTQGNGKSQVF